MSKAKIMIVEDEWMIADDIQTCLTNMDYDVSSIETRGEDAVKKTGEDKPDLVLMDILLKGKMD